MLALAAAPVSAAITVPEFSSRPGAAYTLYLDFGGFSFTGNWGSTGRAPGTTNPYDTDGNLNSFSTSEVANIKESWARVAEKYAAFNINVTTVDPAIAAGQSDSDSARQNYYDSTAKTMHTVIGGTGSWSGGGGGVSFVGVAQNTVPTQGFHTNWVFAGQAPTQLRFIGEAVAHENGHALGLSHQSDYNGTTLLTEYSSNGTITNGNYAGDGTFAPTMGVTYYTQRGLWRVGTATGPKVQNDYAVIGANSGMSLVNDGIGHSIPSATALPLTGTQVNSNSASGVIMPTTLINPNPIGVNNYTKDYFHFFSAGLPTTLVLVSGSNYINSSAGDPGATFDGTLKIYNNFGQLVATATRAANTLSYTFGASLPAGNYYAEIASIGGYTSTFDSSATYFTAGSYFLRGSNLYTRFNLASVNLSGADLTTQNLTSGGLTSTNFTNATLSSAALVSATLTGANLTGALINNANFSSVTGFTAAQMYSTASYTRRELPGIILANVSVAGWNLSSQNLVSSTWTGATLTGTDFTASDLRSASGFSPAASTITRNTILPTGVIAGLNLSANDSLVVRDNALSVIVNNSWTMSSTSRLEFRLADLAWTSTITASQQPTLGGTLALTLESALNPVSLIGATFDLFNWPGAGLAAGNVFDSFALAALPTGSRWNLSALYTSGVVSVVTLTGDYNDDGFVDAADYTVWADNFGRTGALLAGDGNYDGVVDAADYTLWADHFGQGAPPAGLAAVPEPAFAAMLMPAALLLGSRRRR